jgi:ADP-ribose pyrophosphatase YjhB (NUDIX family)
VRDKVIAYVVRWDAGGWQLLVFEHTDAPEAGLQVPAGTVEPGEPLEAALWRELSEESGLRPPQVALIAKLDEAAEPEWDVVRHIYLLRAADGLPPSWQHVVAGAGEDQGLVFEYRWDEISRRPRLAGHQDRWLALIEQSLSQRQARS